LPLLSLNRRRTPARSVSRIGGATAATDAKLRETADLEEFKRGVDLGIRFS
jgi:hypothetical protein